MAIPSLSILICVLFSPTVKSKVFGLEYYNLSNHFMPNYPLRLKEIGNKSVYMATVDDCKSICDSRMDCLSFSYQRAVSYCYFKNETKSGIFKSQFYDHYFKIQCGGLINVAHEKYGASCTANSEFDDLHKCNNTLHPQWENNDEWMSNCNNENDCLLSYIQINFPKPYDITQICIHQRFYSSKFHLEKAIGKFSNGATATIYFFSGQIESCILLDEDIGKDSNWIRFQYLKSSEYQNTGLRAVLAYAYKDSVDVIDDNEDDLHYTNVADKTIGATCEQSSQKGISWKCQNAIDNFSRVYNGRPGWAGNCNADTCIGEYIIIHFPFKVKPTKLCCAVNSQSSTTWTETFNITWSSGSISSMSLNDPDINCQDYEGKHIEKSVKLTISETITIPINGFSIIQVFARVIPERIFKIQPRDKVTYYLPLQSRSIVFGYHSDKCRETIFYFKTDGGESVFTLDITLLGDNKGLTLFQFSHLEGILEKQAKVNCNIWNEFWLDFSNKKFSFGTGIQYGLNEVFNVLLIYDTGLHWLIFLLKPLICCQFKMEERSVLKILHNARKTYRETLLLSWIVYMRVVQPLKH
ncbi:DgyrCDS14758 [Dimorphilus gyrociliatus]|uniref:DgyrCDS14758 n=1 Tax=Dimorphilus gyrociliatus TaxID=2664684 RepID=A0A7I8WEY8_9ANNE|nr:DgyrCDS14758 [Dimorphilus gyrociliatus]